MDIAVLVKLVPDDRDVRVGEDGTIDTSVAKPIVSSYDLNALEAAAQMAGQEDNVVAFSVGSTFIDDPKLKKSVLARGMDKLVLASDDVLDGIDARATAIQLAAMIRNEGTFDVIIAGDGSADEYAQQVGVQLAFELGLPVVNAVSSIEIEDGAAKAHRTLEDSAETVVVKLPAVISVTTDAAQPRIPGMKDILAAGKKEQSTQQALSDLPRTVETIRCCAPEVLDRKCVVWDATDEGAIDAFAQALKAAVGR